MTFEEFYHENSFKPSTHSNKRNNRVIFGISKDAYPLWKGWHEKNPKTLKVLAQNFWILQYIIFLYY